MPRNKLKKFKELDKLTNTIQFDQPDIKNRLANFVANQDIILELACGKAEYALALAQKYPNKTIIAIDIQGERLWYGATQAIKENLTNILFLRIQIEDLLKYFEANSVSEIWITFPDPFPKKSQIKKRLTSPRFLAIYKNILKSNNFIHLKTDDEKLYNYSLESIRKFGGQILSQQQNILLGIQSYFEKKHLANNKTINYFRCKI